MAPADRRPRLSSRQRARRRRIQLAWAIALVGGAVAVLADGAPTGITAADAAYRAGYAVLVSMACAQARRWTWPIVAGGALVGGPTQGWTVVAAIALVAAVGSQFDRRRRQPVGALVGALSAQALLRLSPTIAFGVPSLVAAVATLPSLVVAASVLGRQMRGRARRAIIVATGAAALVLVGSGIGGLLIRTDAHDGVVAARRGLQQLRTGDEAAATESFAIAERDFRNANRAANAWWMAPARLVPVLGQHVDAAGALTAEGLALAEVSSEAAPAVALDEITLPGGGFRVDRLVELQPVAEEVVASLEQSRARLAALPRDWLTTPLRSALDDLRAEVDEALPDAALAAEAIDLAPRLLGADRPQRYLVIFANPAEARELGGFVASLGVLTADDGDLTFESDDSPQDLEGRLADAGAVLDSDVPSSVLGGQPARFVRNWTDTASIDTVTTIAAELYPEATSGTQIDGVLYLDPYVLEAMLAITGPVTIPDTDTELSADDAADHLLRGQYLADDFERGRERKDRLGDAGELAFERLLRRPPRPRLAADVLSPLVQARRLLFSTTDPAPHKLLRTVGLRPPLTSDADDDLLIGHGSRRPSKLDAYIERSIRYDAVVDPDGTVEATITVELTNVAPRDGLSDYQTGSAPDPSRAPTTNQLTLVAYSRLTADEVLVDGAPAPSNELGAHGLRRYAVPLHVPAGASVTIQFRLRGIVDPSDCAFAVAPNAGARGDMIAMSVTGPAGEHDLDNRPLDEHVRLSCADP